MNQNDKTVSGSQNSSLTLVARTAMPVRLLLGAILCASGFSKLMSPVEEFAAALEAYHILGAALLLPVAKFLPWMEWIVGGYLIAGFCTKAAATAAGALNTLFLLALGSTLIRGISIGECGCFGDFGPHLKAWQVMILDSIMIFGATFLLKQRSYPLSLDSWIHKNNMAPAPVNPVNAKSAGTRRREDS